MKILKIEGEFFAQYKKLGPLYFPDNGIIGILGPNGAGKSTIFSAIEMALFGNVSHIKTAEIKFYDAKKGQKWWVELIFEIGGFQYKVFRHETTSKAYLSVNGKTIQLGQTDVTEHIVNNVLQMDQTAFSNAFYGKQDEFDNLNKLTNEQRKKEISKLLQTNNIDKAIENLRTDKNILNTQITEQTKYVLDEELIRENEKILTESIAVQTKELKNQKQKLTEKELAFTEIKKSLAILDKKNEEYTNLINQHNHISSTIKTIENDIIPSIQNQLTELEKSKNELPLLEKSIQDIPALEQKERLLEEQKTNFEQFKVLSEQKEQNKENLLKQKEEIDALVSLIRQTDETQSLFDEKTAIQQLTNSQNKIKELENESAVLTSDINFVINKGKENKKEIAELNALGDKSTCPTCQQVLGKHLTQLIQNLETKSTELADRYRQLDGRKKEVSNELTLSQDVYEKLRKNMDDFQKLNTENDRNKKDLETKRTHFVSLKEKYASLEQRIQAINRTPFNPEELNQLKEKLRSLHQTSARIKHIQELIAKMPVLQKEKEEKENEMKNLSSQLALVQQKGKDLQYDKGHHVSLKATYDASFDEIRSIEKETSIAFNAVESNKKELSLLHQTIEKNKENAKSLFDRKSEFSTLLYLEEIFKNYKIDQLSKLAPAISTIMQNLLTQLTDGKYDLVELDEHYNVFVYRNQIRQPLRLFSGGERKLISLVQRLAISHIIVSKTSKRKFDFLALDEVLGSMDEERQESILEGLKRLNGIFNQILMVTHNSNINELFDYTLRVQQNDDLSSTLSWNEDWDEEEIKDKIIKI